MQFRNAFYLRLYKLPTLILGILCLFTLTNNLYSQPTIIAPSSICANETAVLSVAETYTSYAWSTGENTPTITVNQQSIYTVVVTDDMNNTSSASHTLQVKEIPTVAITGNDYFCEGSATTLDAGPGFVSYQWNNGDNSRLTSVNTVGNFTVIVTGSNGCTNEASVVVNEVANPTAEITGATQICSGGSTTLYVGTWASVSWNNGRNDSEINISGTGDYSVVVTDNNGCTDDATVTVTQFPITAFEILGDDRICDGETTTLTVSEAFSTYQWSTEEVTPSIDVSALGVYSVIITDNNGCEAEQSIEIAEPSPIVSCPSDIFVTISEPKKDTMLSYTIDVLDACGVPYTITQVDTSGITSGGAFPIGATLQSYSIFDNDVNQSTCSFNVYVSQSSTKNIIMENGDLFLKGLYKGAIIQSPDGTCWKVTVTNEGLLQTIKIDCPE